MSLLEIQGLTHAFGDNLLYKNADFTLNKGEHIGVVGQNGAGKSTLIQICTGQIVPDEGHVTWHPKVSVGYLDQYAKMDRERTMESFLKSAYAKLYQLEQKMLLLYENGAEDEAALQLAARYQEQLEGQDFYNIDTRVSQVVTGLGLTAVGLTRSVGEMSGGQRAKVILAKLLLEKPDVLLLDEPTNFLDKEHIAWLSDYLAGLDNAFMVVSHDYAFLEKIANRICDVDNKAITKYYGTYSEFLRKKTLLREDYVRQYAAQQKEIKKTEEFIRKNIAGIKTKMARGRRTRLARMERMEAPEEKEIKPQFHFAALPLTNAEQLRVKHLAVGYQYPVLSNLEFGVSGGQRVIITGFNGIGKSTLLKTLVGELMPLQGSFHFAEQAVIGYFAQDLTWKDGKKTPIQTVSDAYPGMVVKEIRKVLARCGISAKHALQAVETLSGGEQAKVKLCLLMQRPCNFLILDEPTNHLDAHAKEALLEALSEFSGTVLLVSHEEVFYKEWAKKVSAKVIRVEKK